MPTVQLFDEGGEIVATVDLPGTVKEPTAVILGDRIFVKVSGCYRQATPIIVEPVER